jgi:hypothetical protein
MRCVALFLVPLAVVSACLSACSTPQAVLPEGLIVAPSEAATLFVAHRCESVALDGRAVVPPPLRLTTAHASYSVTIPAGHHVVTSWPRIYKGQGVCWLGRADTLQVGFEAVAGHTHRLFLAPAVVVGSDGSRDTQRNTCVTDVAAADTVCAIERPKAGAQTAILVVVWGEHTIVDKIDDARADIHPIDTGVYSGVDRGRSENALALSAGPHSLVAHYYKYTSMDVYRVGTFTSRTTGAPCQINFLAEGGHSYTLRARVGAHEWTGWLEDASTHAEVARCSSTPMP